MTTLVNTYEGKHYKCTVTYDIAFNEYKVMLIQKEANKVIVEFDAYSIDDAVRTAKQLWLKAETSIAHF
jgi:hypothetical protein